uniref:Uncharacterized protein n=1 Tax=Rhizophagus irregularis (strain DAOM 181602 / DAOM 197198 / MUCL 43194) TaxID=747089 RepID=U9SN97_RHIID
MVLLIKEILGILKKKYDIACDKFYALFKKSYSEYIGIINPIKVILLYKKYVYYSPSKWIEVKKYHTEVYVT